MSLRKRRVRAVTEVAIPLDSKFNRLRHKCACYLQPFSTHLAGGGSVYIFAGDVKIRIADHANTSIHQDEPDFNIVTDADGPIGEIFNNEADEGVFAKMMSSISRIGYPHTVKKTVMAKHLGLTVPKLKKLLHSGCYDQICENEGYPNTYTEVVIVSEAVKVAKQNGITTRNPVYFGVNSSEDYCGEW